MALPASRYAVLQQLYRGTLLRLWYRGSAHYCPVCDSHLRKFLSAPRPYFCPVCASGQRHRLVWIFLTRETNLFAPGRKRMLHVAPEPCLSGKFENDSDIEYVSTDLSTSVMVRSDLARLCFPDETFDVIYASHVLEHIVEDRQAMRELRRILTPDGWAILQVPLEGETTQEDPAVVSPEERKHLFGQEDHVRQYGRDYYDRLREAGFTVQRRGIAEQDEPVSCHTLGISPTEEIPFCTKT